MLGVNRLDFYALQRSRRRAIDRCMPHASRVAA